MERAGMARASAESRGFDVGLLQPGEPEAPPLGIHPGPQCSAEVDRRRYGLPEHPVTGANVLEAFLVPGRCEVGVGVAEVEEVLPSHKDPAQPIGAVEDEVGTGRNNGYGHNIQLGN